jgi:hypothetical protein
MSRKWQRVRERDLMRRQGTDSIQGDTQPPFSSRAPRRPQPTKAELRKQGEAALRQWKARNGLADTQ